MSSEEPFKKGRSGAWYLLPIFLTIIGGVIAYFVIKEDDPKKAKNCLYLGIILTAIGIGFTAVSGAILVSDMKNSPFFENEIKNYDDRVKVEKSNNIVSEEEEITRFMESMPYDYEVFGLEIQFLQLQNDEGIAVTEFSEGETYSVVSEITNAENIEKNIHYTVGMFSQPINFEEFSSDEIVIPAFGTATISHDNIAITSPENYEMVVEIVDVDKVEQVLEEFNAADIPGWKPYTEVINLKESQ